MNVDFIGDFVFFVDLDSGHLFNITEILRLKKKEGILLEKYGIIRQNQINFQNTTPLSHRPRGFALEITSWQGISPIVN